MNESKEEKKLLKSYTSPYTGEVIPFRTVTNTPVDVGVVNNGEDLCRLEDFEPIGDVIARFLRTTPIDVLSEYAYDANNLPDLADETVSDVLDGNDDILDAQEAVETYMEGLASVPSPSDSAGSETSKNATESDERVKQSEEQTGAIENSDSPKPSED